MRKKLLEPNNKTNIGAIARYFKKSLVYYYKNIG